MAEEIFNFARPRVVDLAKLSRRFSLIIQIRDVRGQVGAIARTDSLLESRLIPLRTFTHRNFLRRVKIATDIAMMRNDDAFSSSKSTTGQSDV